MAYQFEWSPAKAAANLIKHGESFDEAKTAFGDWKAIHLPDSSHSVNEHRYLLVGTSDRQRVLVVVYTERPPGTRIISARLADRSERRTYGEG